ncbi:MAG: Fur family transcriptional regulator, partial [Thermoanaerobaculia bacterium]
MIYFFRRFKGSGFRMTLARDEIYKLLQRERHLSAEEIYFEIHKNYPNIGIATVYRTLNLLTDFGVIKRREFGDGKARYEISEIEH